MFSKAAERKGPVKRSSVTITALFKAAGLKPCGPVPWGAAVTEKRPGVYVIAIAGHAGKSCGSTDVSYLPAEVAARWDPSQPVIYIGRTNRSLSRRISEFYRHIHGNRSPHRGGQDVKLLRCLLWVYWSSVKHPAVAERVMIEAFRMKVGRFPFANRVRSGQINRY